MEQTKAELLAKEVIGRLNAAKDVRVQWEAHVATVQNFVDGNHKVSWNDKGEMVRKTLQPNEIFRTINLMPLTLEIRSVRLTKNSPHWQVKPTPGIDVSDDDLSAANAYLQSLYREQRWKDKCKMVIQYGDKRGLCPVLLTWDDNKDYPCLNYYDPWDFYPDGNIANPEEWNSLVVPVMKSVEWIHSNPKFDETERKKVKEGGKWAESGLKDAWMRNNGAARSPKGTAILYQLFKRESDGKIWLHYIANGKYLNEGQVGIPNGYKSFDDFVDVYRPTLTDHFYSRPPRPTWIDVVKTIDKLYSNIESYIDLYLQGRWRRSDKTQMQIPYGGLHGQVIDATIGDIEQFQMQPLPQTHFLLLDRALALYEQLTGVHSESLGRSSGDATSGVSIATLVSMDEQNSAGALDNFRTFLSASG